MRWSFIVLASLLCGCEGTIVIDGAQAGAGGGVTGGGRGEGGAGGAGETGGGAGPMGGGGARPPLQPRFTCREPAQRGATNVGLRRVTRPQLDATLRDLLGADVVSDAELVQAVAGLPSDELQQLSTVALEVPQTWARALSTVSRRAAALAFTGAARSRLLGATCAAAAAVSDDCVRGFIDGFGLQAFRRPLDAAEKQAFFDFYVAMGRGDDGLRFVLRRFLQSPSMTFHVEVSGTEEGARVRLDAWAVAARLSYAVTGSMPDAALRDAAARGELTTTAQLATQVERLLDTEPARAQVADLLRYYMHLGDVADPFGAAAAARGLSNTGLGRELREEAAGFAERIFWRRGQFRELMTSTEVDTTSERVANIFGVPCVATAPAPIVLAWNDASAFWHADGAAAGAAQAELSTSGWFVWQVPAGRLTGAMQRAEVELVVTGGASLGVNVNDVVVTAPAALMVGTQTVTVPLQHTAGAGLKLGLRVVLAAGQRVEVRRVSFSTSATSGCVARGNAATHPGLLHRPGLLANNTARTNLIVRGAHVRKNFLCGQLSSPDLSLVQDRVDAVGDLSAFSNREGVERLTDDNLCRGCHAMLNPVGSVFEGYDQLGAVRSTEQGWLAGGLQGMTWPVNTSVTRPLVDDAEAFADSRELVQALADSPTAQGCFAMTAFEYLNRRKANVAADGCTLADAEQRVANGSLRDALVSLLASEDTFYVAGVTP